MKAKPTQQQINDEIKLLKEYRELIPPRSYFGDNNLAKIDAEIYVLERDLSDETV